MKVYVLAIDHSYGSNVSAHTSYEKAFKELYEYVNDYLADNHPEEIEGFSKEEVVQYYFQEYADEESYIIQEVEVK